MPKERILVADDDPDVLEVCRRILTNEGYEVTGVPDGPEAVEAARASSYDLLLTDIMMPSLGGLETAQAIKEFDPDIVCVVMTGYGTMETAIKALRLGFDEFIVKPFGPQELVAAVSKALEKVRLERENLRLQTLIPLFELNQKFMTTMHLDDLLEQVVLVAQETTGTDRAAFWLSDEQRGLEIRHLTGWDDAKVLEREGRRLARQVVESRQQLVVQSRADQGEKIASFMEQTGIHAFVLTPLIVKGRTIGALLCAHSTAPERGKAFSLGDIELLSVLGGQAAIAVENARLFEAIEQAYEELKQLDHLKSEFINIAAHELRTPLAILLGHADLLAEEATGPTKERLEIIVRNAMRLRELINDMLNLRYLETGEARLQIQELDIQDVITSAVQDLHPLAKDKGQEIALSIPPDLPPVQSDRQKLYIILSNLLSNAIKFTPPGGRIGITVQVLDDELEISVSDTGIGIPPKELNRIFDRFYQVEDSLTREHEGLGLGLSIAKGLVELCGGRIWAESEVGKGSTFTFTIPFPGPPKPRRT